MYDCQVSNGTPNPRSLPYRASALIVELLRPQMLTDIHTPVNPVTLMAPQYCYVWVKNVHHIYIPWTSAGVAGGCIHFPGRSVQDTIFHHLLNGTIQPPRITCGCIHFPCRGVQDSIFHHLLYGTIQPFRITGCSIN